MHANEHLKTRQPCVVDRVSSSAQQRRLLLLSAAAAAVVSLTSPPLHPPSLAKFLRPCAALRFWVQDGTVWESAELDEDVRLQEITTKHRARARARRRCAMHHVQRQLL